MFGRTCVLCGICGSLVIQESSLSMAEEDEEHIRRKRIFRKPGKGLESSLSMAEEDGEHIRRQPEKRLERSLSMAEKDEEHLSRKRMFRQPGKRLAPELTSLIISNILSKLELHEIGRSRCVCKEWNAITTDPYFHKQLNRASPQILLHTSNQLAIIKDVDLINKGEDSLPGKYFSIRNRYDMRIVGSCIGFVCLIHKRDLNPIYVYNPITGESLKLRNLPIDKPYCGDRISTIGFGFDAISDKYKVFVEIKNIRSKKYYCRIITLGESSWRTIDPPESERASFFYGHSQEAVFYNGFLHWVFNSVMIMSLDICNEKFKTLQIPDSVRFNGYQVFAITKLGEKLALVQRNFRFKVKMWFINGSEFTEQIFSSLPKYREINHAAPAPGEVIHKLLGKLSDGSYLFQRSYNTGFYLEIYVSEQKLVCMEKMSGVLSHDECEAISFVPSLISPRTLVA